ncbi:MAG TPA: endonuclease III [Chloroflexia bacterium]|nr:endonuclease III [Chloroflexia bacterium]
MAPIDQRDREKWPAPSPGPSAAATAQEVARAQAEAATEPRRAQARAVLALLMQEYGTPAWPILDPLASLIEVILSHRTTDPQAWAAYQALRARWPTWEALRDAPVAAIQAAIAGTTWPEQKAPRIKGVLQTITARQGTLDLDFLRTLDLPAAKDWLTSLEGVGPKSAACVLLFACRRPVLPVDTHLHRVSQRLGLIGPQVTADQAHTVLQALLPAPDDPPTVLAFHRDMLLHGQRICIWRDPRCAVCVIRDWCDYFAAHPLAPPGAKTVTQTAE